MARRSEAESLDAYVEGLTAGMLDCRDFGHQWKPWGARWAGDAHGWERRLRCPRCKTERVQMVSRSGHVLTNRYLYPDGYLAPALPDAPRISRDQFRLESITRFTTKEGK